MLCFLYSKDINHIKLICKNSQVLLLDIFRLKLISLKKRTNLMLYLRTYANATNISSFPGPSSKRFWRQMYGTDQIKPECHLEWVTGTWSNTGNLPLWMVWNRNWNEYFDRSCSWKLIHVTKVTNFLKFLKKIKNSKKKKSFANYFYFCPIYFTFCGSVF